MKNQMLLFTPSAAAAIVFHNRSKGVPSGCEYLVDKWELWADLYTLIK
jgi:hypothetical protein